MPESSVEKVPFSMEELERIQEFYLVVYGQYSKEEKDKLPDGSLGEIVSRKPHTTEFSLIDNLRSVTYENGTPVDNKEAFQPYIFKLESVELPDNQPPVLKGIAGKYDMHSDIVAPLEERLVLHMSQTPTHKYKPTAMHCL